MSTRTSRSELHNRSELYRTALSTNVDQMICPITQELPVYPAIAEDGRIYERDAIEKWLREKQTSPHTNMPMGTMLIDALQIRNMIRSIVETGAVCDHRSHSWIDHLMAEELYSKTRWSMNKLPSQFEYYQDYTKEEVVRMHELALFFISDERATKSPIQYRFWMGHTAVQGYPPSLYAWGIDGLNGANGFSPTIRGLRSIHLAAERNFPLACWFLACAYMNLTDVLPPRYFRIYNITGYINLDFLDVAKPDMTKGPAACTRSGNCHERATNRIKQEVTRWSLKACFSDAFSSSLTTEQRHLVHRWSQEEFELPPAFHN